MAVTLIVRIHKRSTTNNKVLKNLKFTNEYTEHKKREKETGINMNVGSAKITST